MRHQGQRSVQPVGAAPIEREGHALGQVVDRLRQAGWLPGGWVTVDAQRALEAVELDGDLERGRLQISVAQLCLGVGKEPVQPLHESVKSGTGGGGLPPQTREGAAQNVLIRLYCALTLERGVKVGQEGDAVAGHHRAPVLAALLTGGEEDGVGAVVKDSLLPGRGPATGVDDQRQAAPIDITADAIDPRLRAPPLDAQGTDGVGLGLTAPVPLAVGIGAQDIVFDLLATQDLGESVGQDRLARVRRAADEHGGKKVHRCPLFQEKPCVGARSLCLCETHPFGGVACRKARWSARWEGRRRW